MPTLKSACPEQTHKSFLNTHIVTPEHIYKQKSLHRKSLTYRCFYKWTRSHTQKLLQGTAFTKKNTAGKLCTEQFLHTQKFFTRTHTQTSTLYTEKPLPMQGCFTKQLLHGETFPHTHTYTYIHVVTSVCTEK